MSRVLSLAPTIRSLIVPETLLLSIVPAIRSSTVLEIPWWMAPAILSSIAPGIPSWTAVEIPLLWIVLENRSWILSIPL